MLVLKRGQNMQHFPDGQARKAVPYDVYDVAAVSEDRIEQIALRPDDQ